MLPSLTFEIPNDDNWFYEVKYDGFRAILDWNKEISITSRNGKSLLPIFPEIHQFLEENKNHFQPFLPFILDGELVLLENSYKANFSNLQVRGRMRSQERIKEKADKAPCRLLIFDILIVEGKSTKEMDYKARKKILKNLFQALSLPLSPHHHHKALLQMVPYYINFKSIWEMVVLHDGEGIVAKKENNKWEEGKRTTSWLKYKNWKYVSCFITAFEKGNGYFYVGVYQNQEIMPIGSFLFGIKPEEKEALFLTLKENKTLENAKFIFVKPAICVELKYLEWYEDGMREPHFDRFRFDLQPTDCTNEKMFHQQRNLPLDVAITHPDKPLWKTPAISKMDYIHYLREISPYMLPFLHDRLLTVIRYPHGILGEAFYQKNSPDYAPEFVKTHMHEGIHYLVCNNLKTLLWLGNQIAFEFHIPFQTISNQGPSEIVFDLDPPDKNAFPLAIKAARYIKEVLDHLQLISFIKTSGSKGLQIYIPLPENRYSFDETRLFTSFIADYLVSKDPDSFTIERFKKNRGHRLYIDYLQHSEGKTIIAPYSPRGKINATIATPLYWEEVNEKLTIDQFQLPMMIKRMNQEGDPFQSFFQVKEKQKFDPILDFLKAKK